MKKQTMIILSLTLALSMVLSLFPVAAVSYDWSSGKLPDNWRSEYAANSNKNAITATNILQPVNPNASQEAKNLYAYLCTLTDSKNYMVGQFDIAGDDVTYQSIKEEFGLEPAMYSCHFRIDTTAPTFDGDTTQITNSSMSVLDEEKKTALLKAHYDNGNVLLVHFDSDPHELCAALAIQKGLYTDEVNCIVELDATNPDRDMQVYALWMKYQDNILKTLKNLEAIGVKAYLWRPWIEFNYSEFTGGFTGVNDGAHQAFTRVYQQTVQMAVDAGLTGFLSTYSPGCWGSTLNRNPGNEYVDVYAATMYSEEAQLGGLLSNQYSNYDWYVKTGKPIGFAEFSCRSGSNASVQARGSWYTLLKDMTTYWPRAGWFNIWGGLHYSLTNDNGDANGNDDGGLFLNNPFTLHLGEIADYRQGVIAAPGVAQVFTSADAYQGLEERTYTASDLQALGLSLEDVCALRVNTDYVVTLYEGEDCSGSRCTYTSSHTSVDVSRYASLTVSSSEKAANGMYTLGAQLAGEYDANADAAHLRMGFAVKMTGVTYRNNSYIGNYDNAKVVVDGKYYKLAWKDGKPLIGAMVGIDDQVQSSDLLVGTTHKGVKTVYADNVYHIAADGTITFTARVTDIPNACFDTDIIGRAFVGYENENGDVCYFYSEELTRSVNFFADQFGTVIP